MQINRKFLKQTFLKRFNPSWVLIMYNYQKYLEIPSLIDFNVRNTMKLDFVLQDVVRNKRYNQ